MPQQMLAAVLFVSQRQLEQDHRDCAVNASLGFALRWLSGQSKGNKAMLMIRKGQVRWLAKGRIPLNRSCFKVHLRIHCLKIGTQRDRDSSTTRKRSAKVTLKHFGRAAGPKTR